ncbi:MAG: alpha/beta hydrolase [Alphaproteobacteria bacterium]|nr:alpha/beta hydrolase [Alphaproteobacteria bacterium]
MNRGKFVTVDGINTHYLEAGEKDGGPTVLLLHSAEYGGAAELSWEFNIGALGEHFHVLAPDHLGFGQTDKVFDFCGQFDRRVQHIRRFLEVMEVRDAYVIGSSMSGGLTLTVACRDQPDWPIRKIVCCSGGGLSPDNDARKVLNTYDGSFEHMRRIVEVMFVDPRWATDDDYINRRQALSRLPGAWEATAAARFKAPFREAAGRSERDRLDHGKISVPTLVVAGAKDALRLPGYAQDLAAEIPGAELYVFENAGHMGNIECADAFNSEVIRFLKSA